MVWVQLVISAVLFVVGTLLRKGPDINPAAFEDFGFPDVDPTKRIPIIWGKKRVKSLHTMEVQGYRTRAIKSGNFIKKTTVGFQYFATIAMGVCHGPDVTITKIILNNKTLWEGTATPTDSGFVISVSDSDFNSRKDGVGGTIRVYPGSLTQSNNAVLASAHATQGGAPGFPDLPYRGVCYLVFEDFYWGNSPTVGQIEIVCERYPDTAGIGAGRIINTTPNESPSEGAVDLALPEIVHEILDNEVWGLGETAADFDLTSFTTAATTLAAEGNAVSMIWNEGDSIRELLQTLMRQADGFVFKRMATGEWEMNLARDDYLDGSPVLSGLIPTFNETNSEMERYSRGNWDETFNIVDVNWQDRNVKGRPPAAHVQDMANFSIQGVVNPAEFSFPGCHSSTLAGKLASRQLRATAFPLATAEIKTNRLAFDLVPGDMVEFQWDTLGITRIFMRVNAINLGVPGQGEIRLQLVQDVFGISQTLFSRPLTSLAGNQNPDPVQISQALIEDQGYFFAYQDEDNPSLLNKPHIVAKQPQGNSFEYRPFIEVTSPLVEQEVDWAYTAVGDLDTDLDIDTGDGNLIPTMDVVNVDQTDAIRLGPITDTNRKEQGHGLILVQGGTVSPETGASPQLPEHELMSYESATVVGSTVTLTNVQRGLDDTYTRNLSSALPAQVWFLEGAVGTTLTTFGGTDPFALRLQNQASTGDSDISAATSYPFTMRRRLELPIIPGNIRHGSSNGSLERYPGGVVPAGDIVFTWLKRDRRVETLRYQTDPSEEPVSTYQVDIDIYQGNTGAFNFLRRITVNTAASPSERAVYTKAQQKSDGGPYTRYITVIRSGDTIESPQLQSISKYWDRWRYDPLVSPLPSPIPVGGVSPRSPRYGSPVVSPLSPIHSPLSPVPSPTSPFPFPSPRTSPFPSPASPVPSPISPFSPSGAPPIVSPVSPSITPASGYRGFVHGLSPNAYWPMDEEPRAPGSPTTVNTIHEEIHGILTQTRGNASTGSYPITRDTYDRSVATGGLNGDYIEAATHSAFDFPDDWTVSFWAVFAEVDEASPADKVIVMTRKSGAGDSPFEVYIVNDGSAAQGKLRVDVRNAGSPGVVAGTCDSAERIDDGRVHFIAFRQNVTTLDDEVIMYIDGVAHGITALIDKPFASTDPFFFMGNDDAAKGNAEGQIAHVAFYGNSTGPLLLDHYMEGARGDPFTARVLKTVPTGWWRVSIEETISGGTNVLDWVGSVTGTNDGGAGKANFSGGPLRNQFSPYMDFAQDSPNAFIDLGDDPYTASAQTHGGCAAWVRKPLGSPNTTSFVLCAGGGATITFAAFVVTSTGSPRVEIRRNGSGNRVVWDAVDDPQDGSPLDTGLGILNDGEWHHVGWFKRGDALEPVCYVDGREYEMGVLVLAGTGTLTDWIHDIASNLSWAINARLLTTGAVDLIRDQDIAEVMYWDDAANLPTADEMMQMFTAGKKGLASVTETLRDHNPEHLFTLPESSISPNVVPDQMGNIADGNWVGTLVPKHGVPLAADDEVLPVRFNGSDNGVAFANPLLGTLKGTGDFSEFAITALARPEDSGNDMALVKNLEANPGGDTNLGYGFKSQLELEHDKVTPANEHLRSTPFDEGVPRALMLHYQETRLSSPHRRDHYVEGDITAYQTLSGDDNNPDHVEVYTGGAATHAGLGYRDNTTPDNYLQGYMSHVAIYGRALTDQERRKQALRQRGYHAQQLEIMSRQPTVYWRCNDPAGAIKVIDYSGNGFHGALAGSTVLDSTAENANVWYEDAGVLDTIDTSPFGGSLRTTSNINYTGNVLAAGGWFKLETDQDEFSLALYNPGSPEADFIEFSMRGNGSPGPRAEVSAQTGGGTVATVAGTVQTTYGVWHHVIFVASADAKTVTVYLDGESFDTVNVGSPGHASFVYQRFALGTREEAIAQNRMRAKTHDVFFIPATMTAGDVRQIYSQSFSPSHDVYVEEHLGAIAHWKMNEVFDEYINSVLDSNGDYTVGTHLGSPHPTKQAEPVLSNGDNAVEFADNGGIDTAWIDYPTGNNPWSISFFMFKDTDASYVSAGVVAGWGDDAGGFNERVEFQVDNGGNFRLNFEPMMGHTVEWTAGTAENTLMHVCLVYDGGGALAGSNLFIDGVLQGSKVRDAGSPAGSPNALNLVATDNLIIGSRGNGSNGLDAGRLGRMSFYDRALTQGEIRAIYLSGSGVLVTSP
jgi:hypothetical protein